MTDTFSYDKSLGIQIPSIMLPNKDVDMTLWSVVACDQYTSEPEYWNKVNKIVGNNPSTLHLTFPEVYLGDDNEAERIEN